MSSLPQLPQDETVLKFLKKILEYMDKKQIHEIVDCFGNQVSETEDGTTVVDFKIFITFGIKSAKILRSELSHAASFYLLIDEREDDDSQEQFINLDILQDDLQIYHQMEEEKNESSSKLKLGSERNTKKDARKILERIKDIITENVLLETGDAYRQFRNIDSNHDGKLSPQELLKGFEEMGATDLSLADIEKALPLVDLNRDGEVSYKEFLSLINDKKEVARVKSDPFDPLQALIVAFKRKLAIKGDSLFKIFGLEKSNYVRNNKKTMSVSWDTFEVKLEEFVGFKITDAKNSLKKALKVSEEDGEVDLALFQKMVGIEASHDENYEKHVEKMKNKALGVDGFKQWKEAVQTILFPLIIENVSYQQLQWEFKEKAGLQNKAGVISKQNFITVLKEVQDESQKLDDDILNWLANHYESKTGLVDYEEFVQEFQTMTGLYELQNYFNQQMELILLRDGLKEVSEAIGKALNEDYLDSVTGEQFRQAIDAMNIVMKEQEIKIIEAQYDPNGNCKEISLGELDKQYARWKSGDIYNQIKKIKDSLDIDVKATKTQSKQLNQEGKTANKRKAAVVQESQEGLVGKQANAKRPNIDLEEEEKEAETKVNEKSLVKKELSGVGLKQKLAKESDQIDSTVKNNTDNTKSSKTLLSVVKMLKEKKLEAAFLDRLKKTARNNLIQKARIQLCFSDLDIRLSQAQIDDLCLLIKEEGKKDTYNIQEVYALLVQKGVEDKNQQESKEKSALSEADQKKCQEFLIQLQKDLEAKKKDAEKLFKIDNQLGGMDQKKFVETLKPFLTAARLKELQGMIDLLVAKYESEGKKIDIKKVLQVMKNQQQSQKQTETNNQKQSQQSEGELKELVKYMEQNRIGLVDLLGEKVEKRQQIYVKSFIQSLEKIKFKSADEQKLIEQLELDRTGKLIMVDKIRDLLKQQLGKKQISLALANERLARFPIFVKQSLQAILSFLGKMAISVQQLHEMLDQNQDGSVSKQEFVSKLSQLRIDGVDNSDLISVYEALDFFDDNNLSLKDFSTFMDAIKEQKKERLKEIDPSMSKLINQEVEELFQVFDIDGDGKVSAEEIYKVFQSMGIKRTLQQCKDAISEVDSQVSELSGPQFMEMMSKILKDELMNSDIDEEGLRKLFQEGDTDNSGFLSIEEIYGLFRKLDTGGNYDLKLEEMVQMVKDLDMDAESHFDITQFIVFLQSGENIHWKSRDSRNTYSKIKMLSKPDPVKLLNAFRSMPTNFVPSFTTEQWVKKRDNKPSSVFKSIMDEKSLLYKDIRPLIIEEIDQKAHLKGFKPAAKPLETHIGGAITFKGATGIPLPQIGTGKAAFKDEHIVKRAVRIGLLKQIGTREQMVGNVVQVPAEWNNKNEDVWKFKNEALNTVILRSIEADHLSRSGANLLIELVVYVRPSDESSDINEICCGWAKLPVNGGSPFAEIHIDEKNLRANRSGMRAISKAFVGVKKELVVDFNPFKNLPLGIQTHMEILPSTCFIHQNLLLFATSFMNYKAKRALDATKSTTFRKPDADVVLSCFPSLLDNPDIFEELAMVWTEDVLPKIQDEKSIYELDQIEEKMTDFVQRMYPVLFSEEFRGILEYGSTKSAAGNLKLYEARKRLVGSALRYKQQLTLAKKQAGQRPAQLTTFKPFNMNELEIEIWEKPKSKADMFLKKLCGAVDGRRFEQQHTQRQESQKQVKFNE